MDDSSPLSSRKSDHIRINLSEDVRSGLSTGLEHYTFCHDALPELDLGEVDTQTTFFRKQLSTPILISSMTGGTEATGKLNQVLAEAAQASGVALGLGSQRVGLAYPEVSSTFQVRKIAPDILLFANLGAVQLNRDFSEEDCQRAVDMVSADALFLHLNPLQEALQEGGDTNFKGLLNKIELVCRKLTVPVVVKEVGWGLSEKVARQLADAGVAALDVAGAGGTSWSQVEKHRLQNPAMMRIAEEFRDWGIPTAEAIRAVHTALPALPLIASGGLRTGQELAKAIALGSDLGGFAGPFLRAAVEGVENVVSLITELQLGLKITMFAAGVATISDLKKTTLLKRSAS